MSLGSYFNFLLSLVFVIGLIGLAAWTYRRFFMGRSVSARFGLSAGRLNVVESRALDARRRLVLVRRDGVEHLILLGPNSETVVETGIPAPLAPPAPNQHAPSATAQGAGR